MWVGVGRFAERAHAEKRSESEADHSNSQGSESDWLLPRSVVPVVRKRFGRRSGGCRSEFGCNDACSQFDRHRLVAARDVDPLLPRFIAGGFSGDGYRPRIDRDGEVPCLFADRHSVSFHDEARNFRLGGNHHRDTCEASLQLCGALFGDEVALIDTALSGREVAPGDVLSLDLRWQASQTPAEDLKVFVHLATSPEAEPLAQHDSAPANGFSPTSAWPVSTPISDRHGVLIPRTLNPGTYQLYLGLAGSNGVRLPVNAADAVGADRVLIAEITVR